MNRNLSIEIVFINQVVSLTFGFDYVFLLFSNRRECVVFNSKFLCFGAAAVIAAVSLPLHNEAHAAFLEIALDRSFEDAGANGFPLDPAPGDVLAPGWVGFSNGGTIEPTTTLPLSPPFSASLSASSPGANPVLKNANIGIGVVLPNSAVEISFWASGFAENGGVAFAEFFSELDGGGTSSSEILGGGPLAINNVPGANVWQQYFFSTVTGSDVSGGVTLQFVAVAGAVPSSSSLLRVDNISVRVAEPVDVPVPATLALLLPGLAGLFVARRRQALALSAL